MTYLKRFFTFILALFILFEEWGHHPLQRLVAKLCQLPVLKQLEQLIQRASPPVSLVLFVFPWAALLPVKLAALSIIAGGHAVAGIALILTVKLLSTALVARLFALTKPALMQLGWFAAGYTKWDAWKSDLLVRVRASWAWRPSRYVKHYIRRRTHRAFS